MYTLIGEKAYGLFWRATGVELSPQASLRRIWRHCIDVRGIRCLQCCPPDASPAPATVMAAQEYQYARWLCGVPRAAPVIFAPLPQVLSPAPSTRRRSLLFISGCCLASFSCRRRLAWLFPPPFAIARCRYFVLFRQRFHCRRIYVARLMLSIAHAASFRHHVVDASFAGYALRCFILPEIASSISPSRRPAAQCRERCALSPSRGHAAPARVRPPPPSSQMAVEGS